MADNNDWTKKYLDDLNRKLAEARKNQPKENGSTETPRIVKPEPVQPKPSKEPQKQPEKKPDSRPEKRSFQPKFQKKDQRGPREKERSEKKPFKDSRDTRKLERREPPKPMPKTKTVAGTIGWIENGRYMVWAEDKEMLCSVREGLLQQGSLYVGDQVKVIVHSEQHAVIDRYEPRQNSVVVPFQKGQKNEVILATNVNQILLVVSVKEPVLRTDWLDRHLVICEKKGFKPVICCTKIDLADDNGFIEQLDVYRRMGYRILNHSSILPTYLSDLKALLKGKNTVVTGHVGSGKTELVRSVIARALSYDLPIDELESADEPLMVDEYVETRVVRSYRVEGGVVIDTPGISEYELYGILKRDLKKYFREFRLINNQCASPHCNHADEPGCKVREAVAQSELSEDRYQNYLKILEGLT